MITTIDRDAELSKGKGYALLTRQRSIVGNCGVICGIPSAKCYQSGDYGGFCGIAIGIFQ